MDETNVCDDDDAFVSASSSEADTNFAAVDEKVFQLTGSATPVVITTTRRQRRVNDTSSCNYSDFCNNDLSRQIEAMVLKEETAYNNRHAKNSQYIGIAQQQSNRKTFEVIKDNVLLTPTTTMNSCRENAFKSAKEDAPSTSTQNQSPVHLLLSRIIPTKQGQLGDMMPDMKPCDSPAYLDCSVSTRSGSDVSIATSNEDDSLRDVAIKLIF
mmetsp:Transcript_29723/g.62048  ORF Transcript_29723/g.62048 Transcript_29723/m.62048 type:complete len:212 (+) Transcript_29723:813-1448(+)